ncbi:MAG TPA: cytochrome c [Leptospiraceae bacterium]|nr:cytochrome c [Leptospiraceae bacterium]HMY67525.1 cytochrome c [Leptospiraceae bacterium]HMZ59703.1 cytochrome c [Leptospiraceae bacterium]HNF15685.1 cytochrome c [Leptospiraceae bacterium]HNH07389.1 cytochrome c [Leptospiraceae bacterium]
MLSKSQARMFFLLGTVLFSGLFLFLTVDTMQKIPDQTKSANITDSVKKGKLLFDKNNCMGCHTILGEGAYYAPELTKVHERRGPEWIRVFMKDPEAMYPGQRKMVKYNFSEEELSDLISFFKWIGEMDLNGFPPKPNITVNGADQTNAGSAGTAPKKFTALCTACHSVGGTGGKVGPALDTAGKRLGKDFISGWLKDPQKVRPGTKMPKLPLSDSEIAEITDYLIQMKGKE